MTDFTNHSEGYWRSIFIYKDENISMDYGGEWEALIDDLNTNLSRLSLDYALQRYGSSYDDREHITLRIHFPTLEDMNAYLDYLKALEIKYHNHNYDEPYWVKEAYVLGTKFVNLFKESKINGMQYDLRTMTLLLHGFFNTLGFYKSDEIQLLAEIVAFHLNRLWKGRYHGRINI